MLHGNKIFKVINLAQRDQQRHHHRKAGKDRTGYEVRRKNRRVPAGNNADGKVKTYDRVDRNHQRRCQRGEQHIGGVVTLPMMGGPPPTQGQRAIQIAQPAIFCLIAHRGQIGNQTYKPKHQRDGSISANRKGVPHQRAAKLWPQVKCVGIGEDPIGQPGTPQMQHRK